MSPLFNIYYKPTRVLAFLTSASDGLTTHFRTLQFLRSSYHLPGCQGVVTGHKGSIAATEDKILELTTVIIGYTFLAKVSRARKGIGAYFKVLDRRYAQSGYTV